MIVSADMCSYFQVREFLPALSSAIPGGVLTALTVLGALLLVFLWFEAFLGWVLYQYATKPAGGDQRLSLNSQNIPEEAALYLEKLEKIGDEVLSGAHETLEITRGNIKLHGIFIPAKTASPVREEMSGGCAILVHGWRNTSHTRIVDAQSYLNEGISVFLPYLRAHLPSEGKRIDVGCKHYDDLFAWIEKINEHFGENAPRWYVLDGLSMGASTVLMAGGDKRIPGQVIAILADCGYTSLDEQGKWMTRSINPLLRIPGLFFARVFFLIKQGYKLHDPTPLSNIARTSLPVFIIHGGADLFVPTWMSRKLMDACESELREYWVVEGAQHALSAFTAGAEYMRRKLAFIEKALAGHPQISGQSEGSRRDPAAGTD